MSQFRKKDVESADSLAVLGFHLLLAGASARQAASCTSRAVVKVAEADNRVEIPDQQRIAILANRLHPIRGAATGFARFSDITLPKGYAGGLTETSETSESDAEMEAE